MVIKELEPQTRSDKFAQAGHAAETQMAHYLRRAFAESKTVRVLNNLRFELRGEVAQIDHLILHPHGLIVIESKSVTGTLRINAHGDWARVWHGQAKGMPSPVLQATRQGELLRRRLRDAGGSLLEAFIGLHPKRFDDLPIDMLVAVSDGGLIERPDSLEVREVLKADQVSERINTIMRERGPSSLGFLRRLTAPVFGLSEVELARISTFLMAGHGSDIGVTVSPAVGMAQAVPAARTPSASVVVRPTTPAKPPIEIKQLEATCKHCSSPRLSVLYGKHGYYFKCGACDANTAIPMKCSCGQKAKVRKGREKFFLECGACQRSVLFFINLTAPV